MAIKKAMIEKCRTCGKPFIVTTDYVDKNPKYCRICSIKWHEEKRRKEEEAKSLEWRKKKDQEQKIFEKKIIRYDVVPMEDIVPSNNVLYVIGNGFDLMHRVSSSYYDFRDSMGKNNELREMLELALKPEDIWADFEESLGKFDMGIMCDRDIVGMWLDNCGYFDDEDPGTAEFYMAIEFAANLIITIATKLQPAFRKWVEKLCINTDDRPLAGLINPNGKVLCFNYTEFIETMYGIKDVCYIHGCRKNKKQKLIIGHRPGMNEYEIKERKTKTYRQAVTDIAQDNLLDLIGEHDYELTKDSREIINNNHLFFEKMKDIDQIIVIGHSVSPVDMDYFQEINKIVPNARWIFGCFGLNDLNNIEKLIKKFKIRHFSFFRTDTIKTELNKTIPKESKAIEAKTYKNNDIELIADGFNIEIKERNKILFECVLPYKIRKPVFYENNLFVIMNNAERTVLLFRKEKDRWEFTNQLKSIQNQSLTNRRLKHVYIDNDNVSFVYNNRIRRYNLLTGDLNDNQQVKGACNKEYTGTDIYEKFIK